MEFTILGTPRPKQSMRIGKTKTGKGISFQSKKVIEQEEFTKMQIIRQLPTGFKPFDCELRIKKALFIFSPPKSWPKWKLEALKRGEVFYKSTKPDLTDNLFKGTIDAMNSIVFTDDSRICEVQNAMKIYGFRPRIEIEIEPISQQLRK